MSWPIKLLCRHLRQLPGCGPSAGIPLQAGDRILTTKAEYASNVLPMLQAARRAGASVEYIPDGSDGTVDPAALAAMLDERVKAVAITHAASQNGLVADANGSARYCDVLAALPGTCWMRVRHLANCPWT